MKTQVKTKKLVTAERNRKVKTKRASHLVTLLATGQDSRETLRAVARANKTLLERFLESERYDPEMAKRRMTI